MLYDRQYVLIKDQTLIGAYDRQEDIFREAAVRFGTRLCLVRFISHTRRQSPLDDDGTETSLFTDGDIVERGTDGEHAEETVTG